MAADRHHMATIHRAHAHVPPFGTAATYGVNGAAMSQNLPIAGYANTNAGILIPNAGFMSGSNAGYILANAATQQTVSGPWVC